jgi:hypothetical protein
MTTNRQFSGQTYLAIRAAFRDLVNLAGGPKRAADKTRGCQSRISEAMADGGLSPEECRSLLIDIGKHSDTINSMRALVEKAAEAR